jgi:hypothetical protein
LVESTEHRDAFEWNAIEGPAPSGSLRVELELLDRVSTASTTITLSFGGVSRRSWLDCSLRPFMPTPID